jgi:hypothetical protein
MHLIDEGALSPSDVLVVLVPCLGVDGLAYAPYHTETGQVKALDVVLT